MVQIALHNYKSIANKSTENAEIDKGFDDYVFSSRWRSGRARRTRAALTAQQPLAGISRTVHRRFGAVAEPKEVHGYDGCRHVRQNVGHIATIVATAICDIRRVLACHGVDIGKSAEGIPAAR